MPVLRRAPAMRSNTSQPKGPWSKRTISPPMQPITKAWCAENPERYRELAEPPECCPLCLEAFTEDQPAQSPLLGDAASTCRHWACESCWLHIMESHPSSWKCPWCRENLRNWMGATFGDAYCPADAVSSAEIRQFAADVLQTVALPADLEQLAARILRHV